MRREKPNFIPQYSGALEGWATNYIHKNIWRVPNHIEFEDLLQDAHCYFLVCVERYGYVTQPAHFMSLFKSCLRNHMTDLSHTSTDEKAISVPIPDVDEFFNMIENISWGNLNEGFKNILLSQAPEEIMAAVEAIINKPPIDKNEKRRARKHMPLRETTNEYLCRVLGKDSSRENITMMVAEYFSV